MFCCRLSTGNDLWQTSCAHAAIDHHLHDNDAQTVEDLRDIFRESDAGEHYGPFMVIHLVAVGIGFAWTGD